MYANLNRCLMQKGISMNAAAKMLDMPEATFRTKLTERNFNVGEAMKINDHLFPEYDFRYLFKKDDANEDETA